MSNKPSTLARSPSPTTQRTNEDIPPLSYDTEAELVAVLSRLESELKKRIEVSFAKNEFEGSQRKEVESLVLEQFYKGMSNLIWSNCSIAGLPYAKYQSLKSKGKLTKTKPFDDVLHQRVMNYQNQLFDARLKNVEERVEAPKRTFEGVERMIEQDQEYLSRLEQKRLAFNEERPKPILSSSKAVAAVGKGRKSLGANKNSIEEGPSAQQAQDDYLKASEEIDKLLKEIPRISTSAEEAKKVLIDTSSLQ